MYTNLYTAKMYTDEINTDECNQYTEKATEYTILQKKKQINTYSEVYLLIKKDVIL